MFENTKISFTQLAKIAVLAFTTTAFLTVLTYCTIPSHNCSAEHFATLIVLGCPPDPDGSPSSEERARVAEAVNELHAGRADHIILTGGTPHSRVPEATVMATVALQAGVPAANLFVDTRARNTLENVYYSHEIMQQHGWSSAEVISSPSHLARVALIMSHYQMCWRTQASSWPPEYSHQRIGLRYLHEVLGTVALRWFGYRRSAYISSAPGAHRQSVRLS